MKDLYAAFEDNDISLFESFEPFLTSFITTGESVVTLNVQNVNKDLIALWEHSGN